MCQTGNREQKQQKLSTYLTGLDTEYKDCEQNLMCKDKMTPDMKENAEHIRSFIMNLQELTTLGNKEV